ncbi:SAM-dependent methyltransferase [Streptomyces sp. NPDC002265]|uniref:class I SAM-dependent methyltransferase n=1 Tax=Streptomyces sp. NPDC002265 TaxID=3154415 RepID=UPI00332827DA
MLIPHQPSRMKSGLASNTAQLTARIRAVDAALEPGRRLLADQYARLFIPGMQLPDSTAEADRWLIDNAWQEGPFFAIVLLRQRCFEDMLERAVAAGVRQAVLLGAGYDSTALRLTGHADLRWFEVDHPSTQADKLALLSQAGIDTPQVGYVPVDFEAGAALGAALAEAGFDASQPCVVGWLGVTLFLRPEAFRHTLAELSGLCASGSTLVFDYMDQSVIDGTTPYAAALSKAQEVGARGEPYLTGLTPQTADEAVRQADFWPAEKLRIPDLLRKYGGPDPYCSADDFMGVVVAERD